MSFALMYLEQIIVYEDGPAILKWTHKMGKGISFPLGLYSYLTWGIIFIRSHIAISQWKYKISLAQLSFLSTYYREHHSIVNCFSDYHHHWSPPHSYKLNCAMDIICQQNSYSMWFSFFEQFVTGYFNYNIFSV